MTILKSSRLKAEIGKIPGRAIPEPQCVERNGTLLVITKANLTPVREEAPLPSWEMRARHLESFYDFAKIRRAPNSNRKRAPGRDAGQNAPGGKMR
jgi:hypothetical protein